VTLDQTSRRRPPPDTRHRTAGAPFAEPAAAPTFRQPRLPATPPAAPPRLCTRPTVFENRASPATPPPPPHRCSDRRRPRPVAALTWPLRPRLSTGGRSGRSGSKPLSCSLRSFETAAAWTKRPVARSAGR
jgi:hypothetical protein